MVVNFQWAFHHLPQPKLILPLIAVSPNQQGYFCSLLSFPSWLSFFLTNYPSMLFVLGGPVLCTTTQYTDVEIVVLSLASCQTFMLANSFAAQICVFLSALSHVIELGPLQLDLAACARNEFISLMCITIFDISHAGSNNRNCTWNFIMELPLSMMVTLVHLNLLNTGKM